MRELSELVGLPLSLLQTRNSLFHLLLYGPKPDLSEAIDVGLVVLGILLDLIFLFRWGFIVFVLSGFEFAIVSDVLENVVFLLFT